MVASDEYADWVDAWTGVYLSCTWRRSLWSWQAISQGREEDQTSSKLELGEDDQEVRTWTPWLGWWRREQAKFLCQIPKCRQEDSQDWHKSVRNFLMMNFLGLITSSLLTRSYLWTLTLLLSMLTALTFSQSRNWLFHKITQTIPLS